MGVYLRVNPDLSETSQSKQLNVISFLAIGSVINDRS